MELAQNRVLHLGQPLDRYVWIGDMEKLTVPTQGSQEHFLAHRDKEKSELLNR